MLIPQAIVEVIGGGGSSLIADPGNVWEADTVVADGHRIAVFDGVSATHVYEAPVGGTTGAIEPTWTDAFLGSGPDFHVGDDGTVQDWFLLGLIGALEGLIYNGSGLTVTEGGQSTIFGEDIKLGADEALLIKAGESLRIHAGGGGLGVAGQVLGSDGDEKVVWVPSCGADGWVDDTAHTWTFATASTFTIAGVDLTTTFTEGTRLKWTQTTVKYGVVVSSTFSTNTTVTIAVNTDHTIANAAISANFYSYAANPQGYPGWFNFAPTNETGWSTANPFSALSRFSVTGKLCYVEVHGTGTSDNAATSFDAPIACENGTLPATPLLIVNNGTQAFGKVRFSTATLLVFGLSATSETWTASGTKTIFLQMTYGI